MKEYKKFIFYASLVVVFITTFLLSFTLTSNAYYNSTNQVTGVITLGKANVMIKNELPLFSGVKVHFNERINYPISVVNALDVKGKNTSGLIDCILRFKSSFLSAGQSVDLVTPNLSTPNYWVVGNDGYLYYKNIFKVGDSVEIYSSFDIGSTEDMIILEGGVNVEIIVETIQANGGIYKTEWPTAPKIW